MWIWFAFGSALFAGLTAVLAKIGIREIDSHLATAVRTVVVLVFAWLMVLIAGQPASVWQIDSRSLVFLLLSGVATGLSWLSYFRALQLGDASRVAPIDKSSTVLTMLLAFLFLQEPLTVWKAVGMVLIAAGTLLMALPDSGRMQRKTGITVRAAEGESAVTGNAPGQKGGSIPASVPSDAAAGTTNLESPDGSVEPSADDKPTGDEKESPANRTLSCQPIASQANVPLLSITDSGRAHDRRWLFYALASAVFASLTAILSKIGIRNVESNLGTAIRTVVVLLFAWGIVFARGQHRELRNISGRSLLFLLLSGLSTGLSWLCYYRALQDGDASVVVPIDKMSLVVTVAFAHFFLHERLSKQGFAGLLLSVAGTLVLLL